MKIKRLALILIFAILLCAACAKKEDIRKTFGGVIKKGYTKQEVVKVLGKPQNMYSRNGIDTWFYSFGKDKNLFVYFMDDKLIETWQKTPK